MRAARSASPTACFQARKFGVTGADPGLPCNSLQAQWDPYRGTRPVQASTSMTIGELARHAGVGVETVRFYQRRGLLAEPPRRPGGRRHYTESHLTDLRFIRRCRGLGFAVGEVADLLRLRRSPRRSCRTLHERVQ